MPKRADGFIYAIEPGDSRLVAITRGRLVACRRASGGLGTGQRQGAKPADARGDPVGAVLLRHTITGEERFTTPAMLQAHGELNAALRRLAAARIGAIGDAVPAGPTDDQKHAFRYATAMGGKLRPITGVTGAGRIRLINAVARRRPEGYNVLAVSIVDGELRRAGVVYQVGDSVASIVSFIEQRDLGRTAIIRLSSSDPISHDGQGNSRAL